MAAAGKVTSCKDLLMLLLYARGRTGARCEPIRGRTRLMKMVFLFEKEVKRKFNSEGNALRESLPDFTPYDFGPFAAEVFNDLEFLVDVELAGVRHPGGDEPLLEEEGIEYTYWQAGGSAGQDEPPPSSGVVEEFYVTDLGKEFVEKRLLPDLTTTQQETLDEFKTRCTSVPLRALLRYVYTNYPQMATESKIRDELLHEF